MMEKFIEQIKADPNTKKQMWLVGGDIKQKEAWLEERTKHLTADTKTAVKNKTKMLDKMPTLTTKEETENLWIVWFD